MRWFSTDQKPAYFNNAGLTGTFALKGKPMSVKEKFDQTRERYSVLTTVSWTEDRFWLSAHRNSDAEHPGADENAQNGNPPKFAIMFRGSPDGTIIRDLE